MITYGFEYKTGNNLTFKLFLDRQDAYAYGVKINADLMREVCNIMPNEWEKPRVLQQLYYDYKTEQK